MSSVIEVPDWYRTVALVGVDITGEPVVVLLDSTGAIMAVMKGEYAGTLKNIAVDGSGRIINVLRDPTSNNYLAIDASGQIVAVLKATYSGNLLPVACDSAGRIIMIPTDPADIWGNAISMGNAELAARLVGFGGFDRRGNAIFTGTFEDGFGIWYHGGTGTGLATEISSRYPRHGRLHARLTSGSEAGSYAYLQRYLPYPILGKVGFETAFTLDGNVLDVEFRLILYDGITSHQCNVKYSSVYEKIQYQNSLGTWTDLITGVELAADEQLYHIIKIVADFSANKYHRVLVDGEAWTTGGLALYEPGSGTSKLLEVSVWVHSITGLNGISNFDNVLVTQNEPA